MNTEIIRINKEVREEIINLYTYEIAHNKDEDLKDFIKTEREKIFHNIKIDEGFYKGKMYPSAWNYFTGRSDGKKVSTMKKYISLMAYYHKTAEFLSPQSLQYIDSKIKVVYNHTKKLIKKLNKKKEQSVE